MPIHKFTLSMTISQAVRMPDGAKILTVQNQNGVACLWAEVDAAKPLVDRVIDAVGTGYDEPVLGHPGRAYIGTVQFGQGSLVLHYYDLGRVGKG